MNSAGLVKQTVFVYLSECSLVVNVLDILQACECDAVQVLALEFCILLPRHVHACRNTSTEL